MEQIQHQEKQLQGSGYHIIVFACTVKYKLSLKEGGEESSRGNTDALAKEMRGERRTGVLERSRAKAEETPRFNGAETEDLIGSVISIVENGLPLCRIAICVCFITATCRRHMMTLGRVLGARQRELLQILFKREL